MPHSHTAYKPKAPWGGVKEQRQPYKFCDLQDDAILNTESKFEYHLVMLHINYQAV